MCIFKKSNLAHLKHLAVFLCWVSPDTRLERRTKMPFFSCQTKSWVQLLWGIQLGLGDFFFGNMGFLWLNESEVSSRRLIGDFHLKGVNQVILVKIGCFQQKSLKTRHVLPESGGMLVTLSEQMHFSEEPHKKLEVPSCSWLDGSIVNGSREGPQKKKTSTPRTGHREIPLALALTLGVGVVITWDFPQKDGATSSIEKSTFTGFDNIWRKFLIFETPNPQKITGNKTWLFFGRVELVENENYISHLTVGLAKLMSS